LKAVKKSSEIMRMLDERTLEINLPNKMGYERIAMECSSSFAKLVGFSRDRIDDLKTAISEACLNAMEHGNRWRSDARVIITMNFENDTFSVSVEDEGEGILDTPEDPDIDRKLDLLQTSRGMGIYIIKQLVDEVELNQPTEQGHALRMILRMTAK
jgi:serine/threonine-protein kinase RsbW